MDFIVGLPQISRGVDNIWVIVDRLTKSAHFLPVHTTYSAERLFWRACQEELGTRVHLSTTFHPQTDGQSEHTIQVLEDMLRACVMDFGEPRPCGTDLLQEALDQGVMRFGRRGKLSPRCIGPFEILRAVDEVAYELALPPALSAIHQCSMFRCCADMFQMSLMYYSMIQLVSEAELEEAGQVVDRTHQAEVLRAISMQPQQGRRLRHLTMSSQVRFYYAILARDVRQLRSRVIPVVKIRWRHRPIEEATWETEQEMREQFPSLFEPSGISLSLLSQAKVLLVG
ncbi:hypothetical protein MTR67_037783 [Solanum verrucosum]|uniref:Tf2-1-like SH3-like domain-containing protein n=1 Tax=Solanum verrucosum TaxID=315347 RepID=A0AAF0UEK1_SOLVR|nr:hypothetical protein MTR67_037783 [Solanum verrucosum]